MRAKSRIVLLAAFALTSSACSIPLDVNVTVDCVVFQEQRADQATKDWLAVSAEPAPESVTDWLADVDAPDDVTAWILPRTVGAPPSADGFFKRVADNSEKFDLYCKDAPASTPDQVGAVP